MKELVHKMPEELKEWSFAKIGMHYINTFKNFSKLNRWDVNEELQKIRNVLIWNKEMDDKINLLKYIETQRLNAKYSNEPKKEKLFKKMEHDYYQNVLYESLK